MQSTTRTATPQISYLSSASVSTTGLSAESVNPKREQSSVKSPLDLVRVNALMEFSEGRPETVVGLIDGPVAMDHPDFVSENIREVPGGPSGRCTRTTSAACAHGTFSASILNARRNSSAPAICPGCTLLVRPIFAETTPGDAQVPSTTPYEVADAIIECIHAGVRVLNLSVALTQPSSREEQKLEEVLNHAARHDCIVVAAAGNQGMLGSSAITRHPWVIPVAGCDLRGRPTDESNLGRSIGRRGLMAPSNGVTGLALEGNRPPLEGTSIAAPFVTGAIALLWSEFPTATASEVKVAVTRTSTLRRTTVVPPLLDAWAAYEAMAMIGT